MAADGSVIIEILGDAKDITSKLKGIAGGALKTVTAAIAGAGAAIGGVTTAAVKVGSGFEESMSQVAATMGLTVEEIQNGSEEFTALQTAAKDAGATTAFSASEAADALNYLALAGYDAQTSAEVLPSVLNLAAAGGMDLAYASDLATDAMAALGIEASNENLTKFGDQMAKTASKSNTSVSQLGEAILTVGGTAKSLAGGTTELNAALGVLANRGIKGAEGGTALRNTILSLSAPTDKATKLMQELGVSVYDAQGKMRPLNTVFQDLDRAMSTMTDSEKTNVLNDIFNKVDLKSAQALLAGCGDEFNDLSVAIDGAWLNMDSLSKSLNGVGLDLTSIQSKTNALGISSEAFSRILKTSEGNAELFADCLWEAADSGVTYDDVVNALGGDLTKLQTAFDGTTGAMQSMADVQLDNLQGDITKLKSGLEGLVIGLYENMQGTARGAVQAITSAVQEISTALTSGGIPAAIEAAGQQVAMFATKIAEQAPAFIDAGVNLIKSFIQGVRDNLPDLATAAIDIVTSLIEGIIEILPQLLSVGVEIIIALAQGIAEALPQLLPEIESMIMEIYKMLTKPDTLAALLEAGLQLIVALAEGLVNAIPVIIEALPEIITNIIDSITRLLPQITSSGIQIIVTLVDGIIDALPAMIEAIPQIIVALVTGILDNLDQIILAGPQIMLALCEGVIGAIPSLIQLVPQLFVALVDAFTSVDWGSIGRNIVDGIKNGISEMWNNLVSWVKNLVQNLISTAKNIFSGSFKSGGSSRSSGGSDRSGSPARSAPIRSAPAVQSVSNDAEPALMSVRSSAPALGTPVALNAQSDMVYRLRNAVEAEQARMSAQMNVSSGSSRSGFAGAQAQNSNGQTPNIIVRPNVVIKAEGDLAPLARIFKPALDAEDRRVGVGVT